MEALVIKDNLQLQLRTANRLKWRRDKGLLKRGLLARCHSLAPATDHLSIYCTRMIYRTLEILAQRLGVEVS